MENSFRIMSILVSGLILYGCATSRVVPEPKKITFEDAMEQVANGLNKIYDIGKNHPKSGLAPSEVTIEFNISANATDNGKITIDTDNILGSVQVNKAIVEAGSEIKASRENKITIKFTNLFLSATKDSLIMVKKPEEISELLIILKDAGYEPIYKDTSIDR